MTTRPPNRKRLRLQGSVSIEGMLRSHTMLAKPLNYLLTEKDGMLYLCTRHLYCCCPDRRVCTRKGSVRFRWCLFVVDVHTTMLIYVATHQFAIILRRRLGPTPRVLSYRPSGSANHLKHSSTRGTPCMQSLSGVAGRGIERDHWFAERLNSRSASCDHPSSILSLTLLTRRPRYARI